jgi:hypothetical protein
MKKIFFLILFLLLNQNISAKIVKASATHKHLGEISQKEACSTAEKKAKENAIKNALGLKISIDEIKKCKEIDGVLECEQNQTSVLSLNGDITEYKILSKEDSIDNLASQKIYFCTISIEANIVSISKNDNNFQFYADLNNDTFREGDKLKINITSDNEMYLNIFQWFPYIKKNQIVKLFPNGREKNNFIKSDKFSLPSQGLKYEVNMPNNWKDKSIDEHLIFIATKKDYNWLNEYFSLADLKKRIIEIGKKNVVIQDQKTYTIFK